MNTPRIRLDIDATREKLCQLACGHAADALDDMIGEAVRDEISAHVFLDRLLHRAHVLNIKGRSYRLRDLQDAFKA